MGCIKQYAAYAGVFAHLVRVWQALAYARHIASQDLPKRTLPAELDAGDERDRVTDDAPLTAKRPRLDITKAEYAVGTDCAAGHCAEALLLLAEDTDKAEHLQLQEFVLWECSECTSLNHSSEAQCTMCFNEHLGSGKMQCSVDKKPLAKHQYSNLGISTVDLKIMTTSLATMGTNHGSNAGDNHNTIRALD